MAVTAVAIAVGTSATALAAIDPTRRRVVFKNAGTNTVYIGGSAVDTTDGFPLAQNESLEIVQAHREDTAPQQDWYGVSISGGDNVNVLLVDN